MAKPLSVRPSKMAPFCVLKKKTLLERREIGRRLFGDVVESKRLSSGQNIVESLNDGKKCLPAVSVHDVVAVSEVKIGFFLFEDILPAPLFSEQDNLGVEKANHEVGKIVPITFESGNSSSVIQNLILWMTCLIGDELASTFIHRKSSQKLNERSWNEVGYVGTDVCGAS
jgi:hypothetical protein